MTDQKHNRSPDKKSQKERIREISIVRNCIDYSKNDWDSFETSWDFRVHPLVYTMRESEEATDWERKKNSSAISDRNKLEYCWALWERECSKRFNQLKDNEEKSRGRRFEEKRDTCSWNDFSGNR